MLLHAPIIITPRLLPGVQVDTAWISIEYGDTGADGRQSYTYHIDTPNWEHTASDLRSGCCGGNLQEGLESLLAFLGAAAEAYQYSQRTGRESENSDLFPPHVMEWTYLHSDELSMLQYELEETPDLIEE